VVVTGHTYRLPAAMRAAGYRLVVRSDHNVRLGSDVAQLLLKRGELSQVALMVGDATAGFDFTAAPGVKTQGWWPAAKRAMALALGAPPCRHDAVAS
jgi:hypothetical protein